MQLYRRGDMQLYRRGDMQLYRREDMQLQFRGCLNCPFMKPESLPTEWNFSKIGYIHGRELISEFCATRLAKVCCPEDDCRKGQGLYQTHMIHDRYCKALLSNSDKSLMDVVGIGASSQQLEPGNLTSQSGTTIRLSSALQWRGRLFQLCP